MLASEIKVNASVWPWTNSFLFYILFVRVSPTLARDMTLLIISRRYAFI